MQRATLETVAAHARVSRTTVSRVINGAPNVSSQVRARVEASARLLGYVPDGAARTLATSRSGTIAIVICEPDSIAFYDPWFAEVTRTVRTELARAGLHTVTLVAPTADDQMRCADYLKGARIDGVLLLSLHDEQPLPVLLARAGVPTVVLGRPPEAVADLPYVDVDNRRSAEHAVLWLRQCGRSRIAIITGPSDMPTTRDRLAGYRAAIGADYRSSRVAVGDFSRRQGRQAMAVLLHREPDIDAVFTTDQMALGALQTIRSAGRNAPDDIAVVGFDDIEYVSMESDPALTTVHQPVAEMAGALVHRLLADDAAHGEPDILPTRLVVRESA